MLVNLITPKNEGKVGSHGPEASFFTTCACKTARYLYPVRHTFIDDPAGRLDSLEGFLHERQVRDAKHKKSWKSGWGGELLLWPKMLIL